MQLVEILFLTFISVMGVACLALFANIIWMDVKELRRLKRMATSTLVQPRR